MNSFAYFTDIEERFQRRRGSILMLSTLDWALIESWREAGVPLAAVLRGIDDAFDKHDAKLARAKGRMRKVNGLAWCAQAVMQATEEMQEAAIGMERGDEPRVAQESGFEQGRVAAFLERNAGLLRAAVLPGSAAEAAAATAGRLAELAEGQRGAAPEPLDALDRVLTVLEERLVHALEMAVPEDEIVALRGQAEQELAPYRARMKAEQLRHVQGQFLRKRLMEGYGLPRLSLFYMGHE